MLTMNSSELIALIQALITEANTMLLECDAALKAYLESKD